MRDFILIELSKGNFNKEILSAALLLKKKRREALFEIAREKRSEYFTSGNVEVRSVIEISNICQKKCNFCNINFYSKSNKRYLIKYDELMKIVEYIYYRKKRRVLLLQSGENRRQSYIDFICKFMVNIKKTFKDLVVILCLGSLSRQQYKQLRISGADRYIIKFETSNPWLYRQIKPDDSLEKRIENIEILCKLGFSVGTGNIIGLPGQTLNDIVDDLLFINHFKLTMISTSVFIPGENSNYRDEPTGDIDLALNYMAIMRIMYPAMLIPSTSSLEKARPEGQYLGLMAGANTVTVHDGTPFKLKKHYPIYSTKRFTPEEEYLKSIVKKAHLNY